MPTSRSRRIRPPGKRGQRDPAALTPLQQLFVAEYLSNGGNATQAYRAAHGGRVKENTCATEGWLLLRTPKIQALVEAGQAERFKRLAMQGDEAIALLSLRARANIRDAYDAKGQLLPIQQWPETLVLAVKSCKANGDITLHDGLKAAELMAIATGRLKTAVNVLHSFDHAAHLAGLDEDTED